MPTYTAFYTSNEVADLIRRDCQKRTGHNVAASQVSIQSDGAIRINLKNETIEMEPKP